MTEQALSGTRVLELTELIAGPYCTKLMADLGAEVIKIERPGRGDEARQRGPFPGDKPHPEKSGLFLYVNTNKFGVTLNIASPKGREILRELVRSIDILVEDYPPGTLEQMGLDYGALGRLNPRLIMTSITPFGQTGPYRNYKAYPLNTFHGGGEGFLVPGGEENLDRPPLRTGRFVGEYDSGLNAATFTLGALYRQRLQGVGQYLDISKQESIMSLCRWDVARYANEGLVVARANQGYPVAGMMPCEDGYVAIILWTEQEWPRLVDLVGNPEWASDERFKDIPSRYQHREELNAHLLEWTMNHTKDEIYRAGQAKGVAVGTVCTAEDLVSSPHLIEREFFAEFDHPLAGQIKCPSSAYKLSRTPWRLMRPAPLLGQHNDEIYIRRLGHRRQELDEWSKEGVI